MHIKRFAQADMLAVYVAVLAIVFSQFPPIHEIFAKGEMKIDLGPRTEIYHDYGQLLIEVPMTISNSGSRSVTVRSIECMLLPPNTSRQFTVLNVSNEEGIWRPFTSIHLEPDEDVTITSLCGQNMDEGFEENRQKLISYVLNYYSELKVDRENPTLEVPELPKEIADPIINLSRSNLPISAGSNKLILIVKTEEYYERESLEFDLYEEIDAKVRDEIAIEVIDFELSQAELDRYLEAMELLRKGHGTYFDYLPGQTLFVVSSTF